MFGCVDEVPNGNLTIRVDCAPSKALGQELPAAVKQNTIVIRLALSSPHERTNARNPRNAKKIAVKKDSDVDVSMFGPAL